jgi:LPXTG-motif cell wall-anchored protein
MIGPRTLKGHYVAAILIGASVAMSGMLICGLQQTSLPVLIGVVAVVGALMLLLMRRNR